MDARLLALLSRQDAAGFAGLRGSDARATIRVSAALLNEAVAAYAGSPAAIRELSITPRAANRFDVRVKLAKASFLPPLTLSVAIERQPQFPDTPVLVLHLTGGGMMRLAGPAVSSFGVLPPGVRMEADRVFVDLRAALHARGQARYLDHVEQLQIATEEGAVVLLIQARVR